MASVLIVDDDDAVGGVLAAYLDAAGFAVHRAATGPAAIAAHDRDRPDLVILDLMLPGMDGLAVCTLLRRSDPALPIIMLTARGTELDRIAGLEAGADDYVTKPFSPREMVLRVQSVLRRTAAPQAAGDGTAPSPAATLTDGDLHLDAAARSATRAGLPIALTAREFDLLWFLVDNAGRAYRRDQLLRRVWGWEYGDASTVTVHVRRLREKVEADPADPQRLVTVWGVGYRWDPA